MTRGIIYLACGDEFIQEVQASMASLRKFSDLPVTLFTDRPVDTSADVVVLEDLKADMSDKVRIIPLTPYDETLYLDSDTMILREDALSPFELLGRFDLAAAHAPLRPKESIDCPSCYPEFNCGVIFYRRNSLLFRTWQDRFQDHVERNWGVMYRGVNDQPSFAETVYLTDLCPYVLPPDWNYRAFWRSTRDWQDIRILHSRPAIKRLVKDGSLEEWWKAHCQQKTPFSNGRQQRKEPGAAKKAQTPQADEKRLAPDKPVIDSVRSEVTAGDLSDLWRDWFSRSPELFARVFSENRKNQQAAATWLSQAVYEQSIWHYGVPKTEYFGTLNSTTPHVTYTDMLAFFAGLLSRPRYLEIGVSTGKNFYPIVQQLRDATAFGIDIEEMNPVLKKLLGTWDITWQSSESYPFKTWDGRQVQRQSSLTQHRDTERGNRICYVCGDKRHEDTWQLIKGQQFSLVFSDALHNPKSIESEMDFLMQHSLIDPTEFVMVWDDLQPKMLPVFTKLTDRLANMFRPIESTRSVYRLHGTYTGNNQGMRNVGLFVHDRRIGEGPSE
jgi:hypothetical protein